MESLDSWSYLPPEGQTLRAVGVLFLPMVSGWGVRMGGRWPEVKSLSGEYL